MVAKAAYGRRYNTAQSAIADFNAGVDFIICDVAGKYGRWSGKPFSKRDIESGEYVEIRYGLNDSECTVVEV